MKHKLLVTVIIVTFVSSLLASLTVSYFFPRIRKVPTHKVFIYDRGSNTLYISGGTPDDPITWTDIQQVLEIVNATSFPTIVTESTIVIDDPSITAEDLQKLMDSLERGSKATMNERELRV